VFCEAESVENVIKNISPDRHVGLNMKAFRSVLKRLESIRGTRET